jgi:hypothetical protein
MFECTIHSNLVDVGIMVRRLCVINYTCFSRFEMPSRSRPGLASPSLLFSLWQLDYPRFCRPLAGRARLCCAVMTAWATSSFARPMHTGSLFLQRRFILALPFALLSLALRLENYSVNFLRSAPAVCMLPIRGRHSTHFCTGFASGDCDELGALLIMDGMHSPLARLA